MATEWFTDLDEVSSIWKTLQQVLAECGSSVADEHGCDILNGPDHEDCQRLFLKNEDCYQRVLCRTKWTAALSCLNVKPAEQCLPFLVESRQCKKEALEKLLSPLLKEHLQHVAKAERTCEADQLRWRHCVDVFGDKQPECLEREMVYKNCELGYAILLRWNTLPSQLWKEFLICAEENGWEHASTTEAITACDVPLMKIRIAQKQRSKAICDSVGLTNNDYATVGGSDEALNRLTLLMYSGHVVPYFKNFDPRTMEC